MALPSLMCTLSHHAWGASKGKWDTPAPGPPRRSLCPSPAASPHPSHFLPKASSPAGSVPAPPVMVEDNSTLCALMAEPCQMAADGVFPWGPTLASCKDQPSLGARLLPPPRCHIFRHCPWKEPFAEQIPPPPQLPWGPRPTQYTRNIVCRVQPATALISSHSKKACLVSTVPSSTAPWHYSFMNHHVNRRPASLRPNSLVLVVWSVPHKHTSLACCFLVFLSENRNLPLAQPMNIVEIWNAAQKIKISQLVPPASFIKGILESAVITRGNSSSCDPTRRDEAVSSCAGTFASQRKVSFCCWRE